MQDAPLNLSAGEALYLSHLNTIQGALALKLTLMELITYGAISLEIVELKRLIGSVHMPFLRRAPDAAARVPGTAHHVAVMDVLRTSRADIEGVTASRLILRAQGLFGNDLSGFGYLILSVLRARGLVEEHARKLLCVPIITQRRTQPGEALAARLTQLLNEAKALPRLAASAPDQAALRFAALGSAVLAVPALRGKLGPLCRTLRPQLAALEAGGAVIDAGALLRLADALVSLDRALHVLDEHFDSAASRLTDTDTDTGD